MQLDYYKILGISHSTGLTAIKQAAQTRATEIKTAYAVLSQADKRAAYDANPKPGPRDHYATLAVNRKADLAQIKAAAQARIAEVKQAYENLSKPRPATASDSQQPSVKPPPSVASPMQKREDVVVKKPVSPPDQEKSMVFPPQPPTVSLPKTKRKNQVVELAERKARLKAFIYDVLILGIPMIFLRQLVAFGFFQFWALLAFFYREEVRVWAFAFVPGEGVRFVFSILLLGIILGIILINLVLLYRHGQTLGKHICSIKIVNPDGSLAGLLRILLVHSLPILVVDYLLITVMIVTRDALNNSHAISISNTLVAMVIVLLIDSLFIVQNSRRCLHNLMAKTIVVKVFPGEAAAPVPMLVGQHVASKALKFIVGQFPLVSFILRLAEGPVEIEPPPATRVRQRKPANKEYPITLNFLFRMVGGTSPLFRPLCTWHHVLFVLVLRGIANDAPHVCPECNVLFVLLGANAMGNRIY